MVWYYEGREFKENEIGEFKAFVYLITNDVSGLQYIGKKRFRKKTTKPPLKGFRRKRVCYTSSNWMEYYGSNAKLLEDVKELGEDRFTRTILRLCHTLGESSYWEAYHQLINHVLLNPEKYYNNFVGCKIHSKHLTRPKK